MQLGNTRMVFRNRPSLAPAPDREARLKLNQQKHLECQGKPRRRLHRPHRDVGLQNNQKLIQQETIGNRETLSAMNIRRYLLIIAVGMTPLLLPDAADCHSRFLRQTTFSA